ncbi:MAG: DUF3592 domain-containing protein [Spirochaetales bacterium]|nr:DUF3592 domain-containing protein [Spirochaetales bacterium]
MFYKIMVITSVVILGIGAYKFISISTFLKDTEVVRGKVIDMEIHGGGWKRGINSDNMQNLMSSSQHPVIEYTKKDGTTLTFISSLTVTSLPKGDLMVRYSTIDEENVEVDSFFMRWMWAVIPAVIGTFLLFAIITMTVDYKIGLIMWSVLIIAVLVFLFRTFGEDNEMTLQMKQNSLTNLNSAYSRLYYNYYEEDNNEELKREIGTDGIEIAKWGRQHQFISDDVYNYLKKLLKSGDIVFSNTEGVFILSQE